MKNTICNEDCFNCIYDDCILPEVVSGSRKKEKLKIDRKKLCALCGKRERLPNKSRCGVCYQKENSPEAIEKRKQRYRDRVKERKAMGLCSTCGKFPAEKGKSQCASCLEKGREHWKKHVASERR